MIGSLIGWILFGLLAGAIARFLYPVGRPIGCVQTILLGVCGSMVGGLIAYGLRLGTYPYRPAGWILSVIGAVTLLSFGFFVRTRRDG
jgi:uncharacterized membrane protein YeaQ/YmgE (transglycosylase-associated protein family)